MKASILHPWGEPQPTALTPWSGPVAVDTLGGRVPVEWDPQATVTPLGQLPFFTEFLLVSGRFEPWVADCPLRLASPHAPCRRNLLGTAILAILAGHQRYAPINGRRGDTLNPNTVDLSPVRV